MVNVSLLQSCKVLCFKVEPTKRVVTFVKATKTAKPIVEEHKTARAGLKYLDEQITLFKRPLED